MKRKNKKSFLGSGGTSTYSDATLVIYDKVLKTPDSYIAINNISRTGSSFWRPRSLLMVPGLLLTIGGFVVLAIDMDKRRPHSEIIIACIVAMLLGVILFWIALIKRHGLHIELNSGSLVTFLAPDETTASSAAKAIADVMRNPDSVHDPIVFNFTSNTNMYDSSTNYNNQNYGVNYGSVGNTSNHNYSGGNYGGASYQQTNGQNQSKNPNHYR